MGKSCTHFMPWTRVSITLRSVLAVDEFPSLLDNVFGTLGHLPRSQKQHRNTCWLVDNATKKTMGSMGLSCFIIRYLKISWFHHFSVEHVINWAAISHFLMGHAEPWRELGSLGSKARDQGAARMGWGSGVEPPCCVFCLRSGRSTDV